MLSLGVLPTQRPDLMHIFFQLMGMFGPALDAALSGGGGVGGDGGAGIVGAGM